MRFGFDRVKKNGAITRSDERMKTGGKCDEAAGGKKSDERRS